METTWYHFTWKQKQRPWIWKRENATRGMYTQQTRNEYIEHVSSKPITTSMKEKVYKFAYAQTTMCAECTSNNVVAIEFSRRREHEPSTSNTFVRLFVLDY